MNKAMILNEAIENKIALIKDYDKSEGVNSFTFNGQMTWLDKATRVGLINSLQIEKAAGRESSEVWLNDNMYSIPIDIALKMLTMLELYAKDCYNTTEQHLSNIKSLTDLNRVYNYDYTKGYPKRLRFEFDKQLLSVNE